MFQFYHLHGIFIFLVADEKTGYNKKTNDFNGKNLDIADTRHLCWVIKMNSSERLHKYHFLLAVKMGGLARVEPAKKET